MWKIEKFIIQKDLKKWTTLFIEYISLKEKTKFFYIIDNNYEKQGQFQFDTYSEIINGISLGSSYDGKMFFSGDIFSLQFFSKSQKSTEKIPSSLKNLIIENGMINN